ncbi:MAG TPA: adenylate/guanylate cyclase domain-containing protein [Actinomycetota bacterium]|nr:adenylate/guanylate cyclase domain-containing protein [Actinomycetota bacterium]
MDTIQIPETKYAKGPGGHIAYQVLGDGPFDMLFMNAWFSHVDGRWEEPSFARMLRRFASFSRLIIFDKRGTGASDPLPQANTTWEEWADDVKTVMDEVGSEKAAIVGVSDCGPMAMLFAATYPSRVSALVLANTFPRLTKSDDYPWGLEQEDVGKFLERIRSTWGTGGIVDVFSPSKVDDIAYRTWWAKYQRMAASPGMSTSMASLTFGIDVRDILGAIRVPTLVLHRKEFKFIPVAHGRFLGENIPNAKYVEVPGEDGFIYLGSAGNTNQLLDEIEEFLTGQRGVAEDDRELATVMFTDIVGSTEKAAQLGDRNWRELLDQHDDVVRQNLNRFRGKLVKGTGDGSLATFDGPARAIRSCAAIHAHVKERLGIEVRAGLHTGEVEVRGSDIGGITVHVGSRIMSVAGPSETLVSSVVKDLVAGSGIRFADRGVHTLKGVPDELHLYKVEEAPV